ncbi:MAG: PD-(D/E)XK nuclease family protein [Gemmatimonadota bacterium]
MIYPLAQLAALCARHPVAEKIVFVPGLQVGQSAAAALALAGSAWLNLRLLTPGEYVRRRLEPALKAAGHRPLLRGLDVLFLEGWLDEQAADRRTPRTAWLQGAQLARPLATTLRDLRAAGLTAADLDARQLADAGKSFVADALRACEDWMRRERYYDEPDLLARFLAEPERAPRPGAVYAVFDEVVLPELAWRCAQRISGDSLLRIGRATYGRPAPAHSAAARLEHVEPVPAADDRVAAAGRILVDGAPLPPADELSVVQAVGVEGEALHVLRDLVSRGLRLDQVEIAYTADDPYLTLLHGLCERFELPATFAAGLPPAVTRPGQCLLGFLRWLASGLDAAELIDLCQAEAITFARGRAPDEVPTPQDVAALLRRARVGRGRQAYGRGLERLGRELVLRLEEQRQQGHDAEHLEAQVAHLEAARELVEDLLDLVPEGSRPSIAAVTDVCRRFLLAHAPVRTDLDRSARHALVEHLGTIDRDLRLSGSLTRMARFLERVVEAHRVDARGPAPGKLHVVPLEGAAYSGRPQLYVLGLDEGSFPGRGIEDPVLLDEERARLSAALPRRGARPGERVWQLGRVLGMAPGRTTLLCRRRSLADGSETHPCAVLQHVLGQMRGDPERASVTPLLPGAGELALTDSETMLACRRAVGYADAVRRAFPDLVQGAAAAAARGELRLSAYHGLLSAPCGEQDLAAGRAVTSPSRLECLAACPYRYFLRHVLRLEPPEDDAEDPARWLHPLDFGRLLHDVFCEFMKRLTARGETPDRDRHAEALHRLVDERIAEYRQRLPVTYEAAFQVDRQRLHQAAAMFLAAESGRPGVQPVGFEVSFGFDRSDGLSCPESVRLQLGDEVTIGLRGFIDRVDRVGSGYHVWDYKTGSASRFAEDELRRLGSHLQWALYACALDEMLARAGEEGRVTRSGYFFTSDREYGRRVAPPLPAPAELGRRLQPLLALAGRGWFPHLLRRRDECERCDFAAACDQHPVDGKRMAVVREAMPGAEELLQVMEGWLGD